MFSDRIDAGGNLEWQWLRSGGGGHDGCTRLPAGYVTKASKAEERRAAVDRTPRVSSIGRRVLVAIAGVMVVCAAMARAAANAPDRPASQAQPLDPATTIWLIFVDDLHLDFTATGHLKDLFKKITDELVHEGDVFSVVSSGPSSIAIDLTRDRGQLSQARDQLSGAALKPSEILADNDQDSSEGRYRAHVAFSTAYSVMKMLAVAPNKRKAFICISNGYYFDLRPGTTSQSSRENPFVSGDNHVTLERLRAEVAELARQATRANVTIFAIDPRALSGPPTIDPNLRDAAWQQYLTTTRNSLHMIAEPTGGRVIQDDLDGNLRQILAAMR
jgi:hypothetical protein